MVKPFPMRLPFLLRRKHGKHSNLMQSLSADTLRKKLVHTSVALGAVCATHTGAMMAFEKLDADDAAWLTLTTATTVGYGDMSASTPAGRLATTLLMYGVGIVLLAQAGSLVLDYRQEKRDRLLNGKWSWDMDNHIVFLNSPVHKPQEYFGRLMKEFRASSLPQANLPALIVSSDMQDALNENLRNMQVAHVNYGATDQAGFENSSLKDASIIVVLSKDENDSVSDSISFDLISRARAENPNAIIIAEAVEDVNKKRFQLAGANHVIRPIRSYPELLVRTILSPGSEQIIENLFDTDGEETVTYNVPVKGTWGTIAAKAITQDIGIPLGYIDHNGEVVSNAPAGKEIDAKGLIVLAREGGILSSEIVQQIYTDENNAARQSALIKQRQLQRSSGMPNFL